MKSHRLTQDIHRQMVFLKVCEKSVKVCGKMGDKNEMEKFNKSRI